ncbi:bifunctional diaminohydroxyphosphoribosylaminopyrimidine deaminase/5-amino-6-(5-phosphoribosylamino)uracil reductase RibD [Chitinophaga horti]|uniref:Riboflavin biosynthesis protein RibD n=1 Tax=Chitinophaga horti TaxID=2920382 RepID=A0ABY6J2V5_9BACT|nr:bifunctional diaminohydroxyphosphoribosylaminopyrimidine deaminase/5-amino-6-(5-phosphoribosylamino)uracil reductase RibD [Chitinophaga horti]UYQ93994.1 bifunctional diaminohydroxyphosphoribosylaminopyrimidine deaminase/5-amino-6-(5-phosphoribosylamino)uracil reductase RibD [Chitinophaga horti]
MDGTHEIFMQRCLQLASLASGFTAPNPMVGAVLVHNGRVIGEGFHQIYGQAHAEVNCVNSVSPEDRQLIPEATMYVSLEPCAHHGKTPPCADLIIRERIPQVVIGCVDTFSAVSGKGIEKLEAAGVKVVTGVLEQECRELNKRFFTYHEKKRPYIVLKWAQSPQGYIAHDNAPAMISNEVTNRLVHRWRSEEMSIMVGTRTALIDNPHLNNRLWTGLSPIRLILDPHLKVPADYNVHDMNALSFFITDKQTPVPDRVNVIPLDFTAALIPQLMEVLHQRQILSVLVEGGANLLQQFIDAGCWDEARVITGKRGPQSGLRAPQLKQGVPGEIITLDGDAIITYRN